MQYILSLKKDEYYIEAPMVKINEILIKSQCVLGVDRLQDIP